ncbi:MAG: hypothetical protein CAF41_010555 [Nitrospira sp. CG24A]|nr:MAG: hypothetical protein CAF41_010555 [Nitrospira sp. CG24A]
MEWVLSLIIQLVSTGDDLSQATMNKPLKAVIQEHVVCRTYFEHHDEEFQEAMKIEGATQRQLALERLRLQALAKCGVRP